jgi:glycine/D-amino acid oxidase-like deaminating enzyme
LSSYRDISLWMDQMEGDTLLPRAPLQGDTEFDVAIVGGGYTGLWTAYYLNALAPELNIAVLEAHVCGFGASGRNGGWLMGALEGTDRLLGTIDGEQRREACQLITGIVAEVDSILTGLRIDCDFHHGGGIYAAARYPEQFAKQQHELEALHAIGFDEADYRWLDAAELRGRLNIRNPQGGIYTPHVARIQPAMLARGLADALVAKGVQIFEHTRVLDTPDGALLTNRGLVKAGTRVLAMEGFSYELIRQRRRVLPIQSMIIATEPLSDALWQEIGLSEREVYCDATPVVSYGQRTADNRMVLGSRGGYLYGGRPRSGFDSSDPGFVKIHQLLLDLFPQLDSVALSHRWGGTLGVPRASQPHAIYDPVSGLATAGGYLGEGVGGANLMARTLVDLILDKNSTLTTMPWAHRGHPDKVLRRWEPEPLRWLGFKAVSVALGFEESTCAADSSAWKRTISRGLSSVASLIAP